MSESKVIRLSGDKEATPNVVVPSTLPTPVKEGAIVGTMPDRSQPQIIGMDVATGEDQTVTTLKSIEGTDDTTEADGEITLDEAMKVFNLQSQIQDMKDIKANIKAQQATVVSNEETLDALNTAIAGISIGTLKNMSSDKIDALYVVDGKELEIAIPDVEKARENEFKKDYLIYLKESAKAMEEIDKSLDSIESEMTNSESELKAIIAQFGDITSCIRAKLQEDYDNADTDEKKARFGTIIDSFDNAYSLDRLYNHYKGFKPANTLRDYKDDDRSLGLYSQFMVVVKKLGIRTDLTGFDGLEVKYLPEKYHQYPNLFLYLVIKYFAYRKDKVTKTDDGIFLTQFIVNLKNLFADRFTTPEQKETFINNIEKILDLYY